MVNYTDTNVSNSWFKGVEQKKCYCGAAKCRGVLGKRSDRLPATPPKDEVKPVKGKAKSKGKKAAKTPAKKKKYVKKEAVQKSVIITPVKRERKPPFPRKPLTPKRAAKETTPPATSQTSTPEPEPLLQSSDDEDDSCQSEVELVTPPPKTVSPKPLLKNSRTRTRVGMKTYKINKTIAKSVTSKAAVAAAKSMAVEEALGQLEANVDCTPDAGAPLSGLGLNRLIMAGVTTDISVGA